VLPPPAAGDRGPAPAKHQAPVLRGTCYLVRRWRSLPRLRAYRLEATARSGTRTSRRTDTARWPKDDSAIQTGRSRLDLQAGMRKENQRLGEISPRTRCPVHGHALRAGSHDRSVNRSGIRGRRWPGCSPGSADCRFRQPAGYRRPETSLGDTGPYSSRARHGLDGHLLATVSDDDTARPWD
jgi:hypothetical protein